MKRFSIAGITITVESKEERKEIARKASRIKEERTKEKFKKALEIIKQSGEKVTAYRIAKIGNISYNTARKYLEETQKLEEIKE
ncbi:hypothetical protein [Desulfonauticus submarinus]